jgi:hypothetical protein
MVAKQDLKDLKALIALCKKEGIKSVELNGVKIEFNPYTIEKRTRKAKSQDPVVNVPYSDEDALFWSADGIMNG